MQAKKTTLNFNYYFIFFLFFMLVVFNYSHNIALCVEKTNSVISSPIFNALVSSLKFNINQILKESTSAEEFIKLAMQYLNVNKPWYLADKSNNTVLLEILESIIEAYSKAESTESNIALLEKAKSYKQYLNHTIIKGYVIDVVMTITFLSVILIIGYGSGVGDRFD